MRRSVREMSLNECRVLVAEDDEVFRETVAELLRLEGYVVESVANGAEALASVAESRPSVMLLDMYMPVLDGQRVAEELETLGVDVPLVVMTGAQELDYAAFGINAQDWLEKPFKMKELLPAIERALN
jgi:CheY-like chemotaxis protein